VARDAISAREAVLKLDSGHRPTHHAATAFTSRCELGCEWILSAGFYTASAERVCNDTFVLLHCAHNSLRPVVQLSYVAVFLRTRTSLAVFN